MSTVQPSSAEPPRDRGSLENRTVVIFGGASGIGLEAGIQAKAIGAKVIVVGFDAERTEAVASANGFAAWRVADVTKSETIHDALSEVGHVDHLVLLAGTFVVGKVLDADIDHLHKAFDERVWPAIHALRALGDRLAADASVTLISGALADRPTDYGTAVLAAASAAMEALARGLALELAPRRFNTLSPGPIDSPLLTKALGAGREAAVAGMKAKLPLHRLGSVAEAGAAVVFLMTNGWMNGATLNIDGGSRLV